jgi:hypothetical protein
MKFEAKFDDVDRRPAVQSSILWTVVFGVIIILLMTKVLWGYWERDLTYGDTASYFRDAALWHASKMVNIVWSPLYTAYYGSWLGVSENAAVATFLHRLGLIVASTALVAWLGLRTLPKVFALLLVCWWVALPIHYDTLYEVHLFGAIPVIVLALVALTVGEKWRLPLLSGIALAATVLIRNEYVLAVGLFWALGAVHLLRRRRGLAPRELCDATLRHAVVLLAVGIIIAFFYSASYIKGHAIKEASEPKHTLNMCQVYAFGYQQRNPAWTASPWTECSGLMQEKFGMPFPSLRQMIAMNPKEVAEHFLWNLSLTSAGLEVLLFNATTSRINPDYPPVLVVPILPSVLLGISLLIIVIGTTRAYRNKPVAYVGLRNDVAMLAPVLLAVLLMSIAVILTQRPRPSYLLGAGILYVWLALSYVAAVTDKYKTVHSHLTFVAVAVILLLILPSYKSLPLHRQKHAIKLVYNALIAHQARLCRESGRIALGDYVFEVPSYLCSPYSSSRGNRRTVKEISIGSLGMDAFVQPSNFARALDMAGVTAVVIDPYLIPKNPGLQSCPALRDGLLKLGWQQLSYSIQDDGRCIAAYIKDDGTDFR